MTSCKHSCLTLVTLCLALVGCELLGLGDDIRYTYATERAAFAVEDSIKAVFTNYGGTLYVGRGCRTPGIEQFVGGTWRPVELSIVCAMVVLPPLPLHPGQAYSVRFPPQLLQAADLHPGTYRLTLFIATSQDGDAYKATSNRFEIEQRSRE